MTQHRYILVKSAINCYFHNYKCTNFCFVYLRASTSGLIVSLGRQTQEGSNPNEVSRQVTQIINHPDYNSATNDNDICLLKLSSPVTFTKYILPVCLAAPDSTLHSGIDSWVTGWGNIGSGGGSERVPFFFFYPGDHSNLPLTYCVQKHYCNNTVLLYSFVNKFKYLRLHSTMQMCL